MRLLLAFNNFLLSRSFTYSSAESVLQAEIQYVCGKDRRLPSFLFCKLERNTEPAPQVDSALQNANCHYGVGSSRISFLLITFGPCSLFRAVVEFLLPHLSHMLEIRIPQ